MRAAENGHLEVVKTLIERTKDVYLSQDWCFDLVKAASMGMRSAVRTLLDAGVMIDMPVDSIGNTALIAAAGNSREQVVQLLLDEGANIEAENDRGETAIICALALRRDRKRRSQAVTIKQLINKGANVRALDSHGTSALHYAAQYNNSRVVDLLLRGGADPHALNRHGMSPLHYALEKGYQEVADKLNGVMPGIYRNR